MKKSASENLNNFGPSQFPHGATDFSKIKIEHFLPCLKEAIEIAKHEVDQIRNCSDLPTFANTILALENSGEEVGSVSTVFHNLLSAHTNDEMQKLAQEIGPILSKYSNDIMLDGKLFERIRYVYENDKSLVGEDQKLTEKYHKDFVRGGASLAEDKKTILRKIDEELSKLGPQFSENVLKATNQFFLHLTDEKQVEGLTPDLLAAAQHEAKQKGFDSGWVVNLQAPSYVPFMQFGRHRETREKLHKAYLTRSTTGELSNVKNVAKIVSLRHQRAQLMGYKNHADFVLERRMAASAESVTAFLKRMLDASHSKAKQEIEELKTFAKQTDGLTEMKPWDVAYYAERLKEQKFAFSADELRPYFKLENVLRGAFQTAEKLYGLEFKKVTGLPVYHQDVETFEVWDTASNTFIGLFYADFFPRESKSGGAWMTDICEQGLFQNQIRRPHVSIVCNFTKPTADKPSLLTLDEVLTLFHEFGHALHSLLSDCKYRSISGTNVYWDFVELPSQIMENWVEQHETLEMFARHFENGSVLPDALIQKIKASSKFMAGYYSLRQLTFAYLDMHWHGKIHLESADVFKEENSATDSLALFPILPEVNVSCSFSHIFAGGYSAGYYSYKWAEVLDADAFEEFKSNGIFNRDVANRFRTHILSKGGTDHPMTLYKNFRGREPDPNALLRREGLI
jgi:peptidyl-dipeptidase Dcp